MNWRALIAEAAARLDDTEGARRIAEEATGWTPAELVVHLDEAAGALPLKRFAGMVDRRAAGEPLQYVLGSWGFRTLDLLVDRRVLIPRPETEIVVEEVLAAVDRRRAARRGQTVRVLDLGCGSGAIALSVAAERWPHVDVWATDVDDGAVAVTRANLAGLGRRATAVRVAAGSWFEPLPAELRGSVDVVASNPPYVAAGDPLPDEVAGWEPHGALVAGPTGLEAIEIILGDVGQWLVPGGEVVLELGATQGAAAIAIAARAGLVAVSVGRDLNGRDRFLRAALSP